MGHAPPTEGDAAVASSSGGALAIALHAWAARVRHVVARARTHSLCWLGRACVRLVGSPGTTHTRTTHPKNTSIRCSLEESCQRCKLAMRQQGKSRTETRNDPQWLLPPRGKEVRTASDPREVWPGGHWREASAPRETLSLAGSNGATGALPAGESQAKQGENMWGARLWNRDRREWRVGKKKFHGREPWEKKVKRR